MSMLNVFLLYCIQAHLLLVELFVCYLSTRGKCKLHLRLHPPDAAFHLYLTGTSAERAEKYWYKNYTSKMKVFKPIYIAIEC